MNILLLSKDCFFINIKIFDFEIQYITFLACAFFVGVKM
jgi:hypothetical protein